MVAQGKADSPIRAATLRDMLLDPYTVSDACSYGYINGCSSPILTVRTFSGRGHSVDSLVTAVKTLTSCFERFDCRLH